MAVGLNNPFSPLFGQEGELLVGGSIGFYASGTWTPKPTYPTQHGGVATEPNPNPLRIGSDGRTVAPVFLEEGHYKIVTYNAAGEVVDEFDPYVSTDEPVSADYIVGNRYMLNDTARSPENAYLYVSLADNNIRPPSASPDSWSRYRLLRRYNPEETYDIDATVYDEGLIYTSLKADNIGNKPSASPAQWVSPKISGPPKVKAGLLSYASTPAGNKTIAGLGFRPTSLTVTAIAAGSEGLAQSFSFRYAGSEQMSMNTSFWIFKTSIISTTTYGLSATEEMVLNANFVGGSTTIKIVSLDSDGFTLNVNQPQNDTAYLVWRAQS